MTTVVAEDAGAIVSTYRSALELALGKTFLITGAGGMLGGYAVHTLMALARTVDERAKPAVIAEVRNVECAMPWLGQYTRERNFRFCECAVEDIVTQKLPHADYVIHAASPASPAAFRMHPLSVIRANVLGTMSALQLVREGGGRLCLISSLEVYGMDRSRTPGRELSEHDFMCDDPLDVRSAYPVSKRMAENLCACQRAEYGTDFVTVRPGHTYGPGMQLTDTRVQTQFMCSALRGQGITMRSDGRKTRAYTYVSDACAAVLLTLLHGDTGQAYNIANNDAVVSIRQLAETILAQAAPASGTLTVAAGDSTSNMWSRMDAPALLDTRALRQLGWRPHVGIEEGIARTLRHYREEGAA